MGEQCEKQSIQDNQHLPPPTGTDQPDSGPVAAGDSLHHHPLSPQDGQGCDEIGAGECRRTFTTLFTRKPVDPATPMEEIYPNEYLAFRLGRLMMQLPRAIENAYLIDSFPLCDVYRNSSDRPHVRDEFGVLDRVLAYLETTLEQLNANAPSISKQVVQEALAALSEVTHQVLTGLGNGDAAQLSEWYSELGDITRECSYEKFADDPLNRFLAKFRGEDALDEETPAKSYPPKLNGIESPLNCESWEGFKKRIHELVSRLGELSAFFEIGRSLEQRCETHWIKESVEFADKSLNQLHRKLTSAAGTN